MARLTLELPSAITYVAGTINEVVTVFEQDSLNRSLWHADVEAAQDSQYHICLEMHDEAGNMGTYESTLEYILPVFVFDRTQEDVDRVKELQEIGWRNMTPEQKQEWLAGMKGCLNTADLKRIENDIYVIGQIVEVPVSTRKDSLPEIPDVLYFRRMLENVSALRDTGYLHVDTPPVPNQPLNTYQKINDVERILHDVYEVYMANISCWKYTGSSAYAGEELGLLI